MSPFVSLYLFQTWSTTTTTTISTNEYFLTSEAGRFISRYLRASNLAKSKQNHVQPVIQVSSASNPPPLFNPIWREYYEATISGYVTHLEQAQNVSWAGALGESRFHSMTGESQNCHKYWRKKKHWQEPMFLRHSRSSFCSTSTELLSKCHNRHTFPNPIFPSNLRRTLCTRYNYTL